MSDKITDLVKEIKDMRGAANPVTEAWINACEKIGLPQNDPMIHFGLMFSNHPDLVSSTNAYHNQVHAADAVTCAGTLAKEEFSKEDLKQNGSVLIFSMLCHDIAHTGSHNEFDYQLEKEAVSSMKSYVKSNPEIETFWNNNLASKYGNWNNFSSNVEQIILGTDFKNGPKENVSNYGVSTEGSLQINKLKLLANEADILPSCISTLGPELGQQLAAEQNNAGVASWKGREFFIGKLATFGSKASESLGIQKHIDDQLKVIAKYGASILDQESQNGNFLKVAEKVSKEASNNFTLDFSEKLKGLRDMFLNIPAAGKTTKYK